MLFLISLHAGTGWVLEALETSYLLEEQTGGSDQVALHQPVLI